jgi:stage V sporulation protein R
MHNVCAYGLPTRARHWSYGRSYDHQKTYGEMGLSKVYEIILNNNPSYAFMLDTNSEVQNLFIAAHCYGHSDFFKHNYLFQSTNRNMIRHAADHAGRIEKYIEKYGFDKVEHIMDIGFALDGHIDWHKGQFRKPYGKRSVRLREQKRGEFDDLGYRTPRQTVVKEVLNDKFPPHPENCLGYF